MEEFQGFQAPDLREVGADGGVKANQTRASTQTEGEGEGGGGRGRGVIHANVEKDEESQGVPRRQKSIASYIDGAVC